MCCSEKNDEKENTYYKNFPARASLLAEAYNVIGSQLSRGLPCHYALPRYRAYHANLSMYYVIEAEA